MTKHVHFRYLPLIAVLVISLAFAVAGCKKKAPKEEPPPPPPPQVEEVEEPAAPDTTGQAERERQAAMQADRGRIQTIYFDYDMSNIRADMQDEIATNAEILRRWTEWQITLSGHCDERGTNEYNLALGERRAAATKQALVASGVDGGRLNTVSYGEERPAAQGSNEDAWARNRRCELEIR